jgi:hypothetical protein
LKVNFRNIHSLFPFNSVNKVLGVDLLGRIAKDFDCPCHHLLL